MTRVIDTNTHVTSKAITAMQALGVSGVLRYLGTWPSGKGMDKAEADLIQTSGIQLAAIYESGLDQMLTGDGASDAKKAQIELVKLGASGAFIWFCCDTEIATGQLPTVMRYLDRCVGVLGFLRVGVYGGYNVCKAALDGGHASKAWQAYGFSGNRKSVWVNKEPGCVLFQHTELMPPPTGNAAKKEWGELGGLDYDPNEVNGDWGAFGAEVAPPVVPPTTEVPMTKRDTFLHLLNSAADNPDHTDEYVWGAEGGTDRDKDGFPEADCSGGFHLALTSAGISDSRTTADGYKNRGSKIASPSQIGDFGVLLNANGTAHHIGMFTGDGHVVEWKGAAYGVVRTTVTAFNARGAKWYRIAKYNAALALPAGAPVNQPVTPPPVVSTPAGGGNPVIKQGSGGAAVKRMQGRLIAHGLKVSADGDFGPDTKKHVIEFQKAHGLEADGVVGPKTWEKLYS